MKYVSIDLETTGLDPDECQILELGAVIDDLGTPFSELPIFRYRVKEPFYQGQPYALSMHADLFRELAISDFRVNDDGNNGDIIGSEESLTGWLALWLKENGINSQSFVASGKNFANFDAPFLRMLPQAEEIKWHHRILDPGSMFVRATDAVMPSTEVCIERAGIVVSGIPGEPHTAIHDALVVCALIRKGIGRYPL